MPILTGWAGKACILREGRNRCLAHGNMEGNSVFCFMLPMTRQALQMGGYKGRCLRLQILGSDDCYMRPAVHYIPVIRDLQIGYRYEGQTIKPDGLGRLCGARWREDLMPLLQKRRSLPGVSSVSLYRQCSVSGFDQAWRRDYCKVCI